MAQAWDGQEKFLTHRAGNSVENRKTILVSDLVADTLALCTGAGAGTFVARRPGGERG